MPEYKSQSARDAQASGYGDRSYWNHLEKAAHEHHRIFMAKGDKATADKMLTQSLGEALQGNDGI